MLHPIKSRLARAAALGAVLACAQTAQAGPIPSDTFLQFSFDGVGAVSGCADLDPAGQFCSASSGTPTSFLDAPAWTFDAPDVGAVLTVLDAFGSGDRFEVFDFGSFVGRTSLPARSPVDCGDDPLNCLQTPGMSTGVFALGAGAHSLTLRAIQAGGLGSGYLHVTAAVPEPASIALVLGALGLAGAARQRKRVSIQFTRSVA
jgi:PEP-CTERM motif